ncbi:MAG: hypothetical protein II695_09585 [Oscillospiraceae bacterium]|nr:hypothetical protein [Oscillospiraceae bacterium]
MYYGKKKTGLRFRLSFVLLFVAASFIGCFVMYMKGGDDDPLAGEPVPGMMEHIIGEEKETEPVPELHVDNPVPLSVRAADGYMNNILYVGDPIVSGIFSNGFCSSGNVLVLSEDADIEETLSIRSYAAVYLMFTPTNIHEEKDRDAFLSRVSTVVDKIRSCRRYDIYIVSVLPVSADSEGDGLVNADIDKVNSALLAYCNDARVYYIDENTYFKGSDGRLRSSYSDGKGGLSEQAYNACIEMIRTHTAIKER